MLSSTWVKSDGITDVENEYDNIACRAHDLGMQVSYIVGGVLRTVVIQGVFDVCTLEEALHGDEINNGLEAGYVAIPVVRHDGNFILLIGPDYELGSLTQGHEVPDDISIVEQEESADPDTADEELRNILEIM